MTTQHDIALLRLVAQGIAGPGLGAAVEVVRWLTAVQAQDHNGALTSVAMRASAGTLHAVEAAFNAGEIVKSWPMRGTLHLVAAEDLPWMLQLLAPRVTASRAARHAQLDIDDRVIAQAAELALGALAGGQRLRRAELLAVWEAGGVVTSGQRGYHLLVNLAETGILCFGPLRDGEPQVVLIDEWILHPHRPDREEALCELALRYFRSHGPAPAKDFSRWAKLVAADAKAGLAIARPQLDRVVVEGVEHLMDPRTPDLLDECQAQARGVFLLPGFDEFILGYGDRSAMLAAEHASRIVPGGNGVFQPTVVSDGQVVGTWKHAGSGAQRTVAATPFSSFSPEVTEAIPLAYAAAHAAAPHTR